MSTEISLSFVNAFVLIYFLTFNIYKYVFLLFLIYWFDNDDMKSSKSHVVLLSLIFLLKCLRDFLTWNMRCHLNFVKWKMLRQLPGDKNNTPVKWHSQIWFQLNKRQTKASILIKLCTTKQVVYCYCGFATRPKEFRVIYLQWINLGANLLTF